jgi:hypothetical protein
VDCRQPLVPGGYPAFPGVLQMLEKVPHDFCGKIKHRDLVDFLLYLQGGEWE